MFKRSMVLVALASLTAFYYSCGVCSTKTIDCPGFNDSILNGWFPYSASQVLVFTDSLQETDTFHLTSTISSPYQTHTGFNAHPDCYMNKTFASVERDSLFNANLYVTLNAGLHLSDYVQNRSIEIMLRRADYELNQISDNDIVSAYVHGNSAVIQRLANFQIGNASYANVFKITADTTIKAFKGIYQIFVANRHGIIGYSEYPSLKTWIKK